VKLEKEAGIVPSNMFHERSNIVREAALQLKFGKCSTLFSDKHKCLSFGKQKMSVFKFCRTPVPLRLRLTKEVDKLSGLIELEVIFTLSKISSLKTVVFWRNFFQLLSSHVNKVSERSSDSNLESCEIWEGISPRKRKSPDRLRCVRLTNPPKGNDN